MINIYTYKFILSWTDRTSVSHSVVYILTKEETEDGRPVFKFIDQTHDKMLPDVFKTPIEATEYLDKWANAVHGSWIEMPR